VALLPMKARPARRNTAQIEEIRRIRGFTIKSFRLLVDG
jgi:hypothetical protein